MSKLFFCFSVVIGAIAVVDILLYCIIYSKIDPSDPLSNMIHDQVYVRFGDYIIGNKNGRGHIDQSFSNHSIHVYGKKVANQSYRKLLLWRFKTIQQVKRFEKADSGTLQTQHVYFTLKRRGNNRFWLELLLLLLLLIALHDELGKYYFVFIKDVNLRRLCIYLVPLQRKINLLNDMNN